VFCPVPGSQAAGWVGWGKKVASGRIPKGEDSRTLRGSPTLGRIPEGGIHVCKAPSNVGHGPPVYYAQLQLLGILGKTSQPRSFWGPDGLFQGLTADLSKPVRLASGCPQFMELYIRGSPHRGGSPKGRIHVIYVDPPLWGGAPKGGIHVMGCHPLTVPYHALTVPYHAGALWRSLALSSAL